ncbi:MAG: hypothetical protein M1817_003450 [Caeruleum heppii]|nr:MAG: hypothetical protein M1817_003450 [Caeruleum heppii]
MTRRAVYGVALVAFLAASAMTLAAIIIPKWISWDSETPSGTHIHYTYGLHRRCSSLTGTCDHFPQYDDCHGEDRYFCSMWRSVGWMMSFAVVLEGMTLVAYITILAGGRQKRETGWKVLSSLLLFIAVVQCAGVAIIVSLASSDVCETLPARVILIGMNQAYLYDHDDRFFPGWRLDTSWVLCTVSWIMLVLCAIGIGTSAYVLPSEGGYNLIPDDDEG